jgi:hypothetical protein
MTDYAMYLGEDWSFNGTAKMPDGTPMDLTGGTVELRIASPSASILKVTSPSGITIDAGQNGTYSGVILASAQTSIAPGSYAIEVVSITVAGRISVQNEDRLTLKMSQRKLYP